MADTPSLEELLDKYSVLVARAQANRDVPCDFRVLRSNIQQSYSELGEAQRKQLSTLDRQIVDQVLRSSAWKRITDAFDSSYTSGNHKVSDQEWWWQIPMLLSALGVVETDVSDYRRVPNGSWGTGDPPKSKPLISSVPTVITLVAFIVAAVAAGFVLLWRPPPAAHISDVSGTESPPELEAVKPGSGSLSDRPGERTPSPNDVGDNGGPSGSTAKPNETGTPGLPAVTPSSAGESNQVRETTVKPPESVLTPDRNEESSSSEDSTTIKNADAPKL